MRLGAAALMPLSADEAYYWTWSHALQPGYLDHPPMVALWIRLGTTLAGETPFGIRLLGPLAGLAGSLLLVSAARDFVPAHAPERGPRAGTVAVVLLNATLVLNAGSVLMTPDTPLLFFWTAALATLGRLLRTGRSAWWLAVGASCGFALDSKYTAVLLGPSLIAWIVLVPSARHWLRCRATWAGGALALLCFAPVLWWNASHGWASFAKQGGRTQAWHPEASARFIGELLAGQVGLATPLVFLLLCLGVARAWAAARRGAAEAALLVALVLLPACVFVQHALGDRVQANWPAILYPAAAIAAAGYARRAWLSASALGVVISLVVLAQAALAPLSLPRALDFTLIRLAGWSDLAGAVFVAGEQAQAEFVAADDYGLASALAFRLRARVVSGEARWRLFDLPEADLSGRVGVLVRSTRLRVAPDPALWPGAVLIGTAQRARGGRIAETYQLYRVVAGGARLIQLPQPRLSHAF